FRDKGIKGIVVKYNGLKGDANNPIDMLMIRKAGKRINKEIAELDDKQNQMRKVGTAHLVEIMDHFDLLPVQNFRFGAHPDHKHIDSSIWHKQFTQGINDSCWAGCTMSCSHGVDDFPLQTGPYKGQSVLVDGPEYESVAGLGSNIGVFDPLAVIEMNFYCDTYGIDTISYANSVAFVMECWQCGILDAEKTGGLDLSWGNAKAALEILHQMAGGEGFGVTVGQGTRFMKQFFADEYGADGDFLHDIAMEVKGMEISEYVTKESIAQQGGYGMALKGGQHDEAWLIFMDQVNKQLPTFEDKPEAEYLLYLGCAGSYDDRTIKVAKALVKLLDHAKIDYAVLGADETCCGDQARRVGNEYLAQIQAQTNIEVWDEMGIKKIITICPHGYNMMKNEYPDFGGNYEVLHHTELLEDLVAKGVLKPQKEVPGKITFHDSCYLGRYNDI
ncbi:MAG: hypothetical protein HN348_33730, partial [Proteobacteria bacterium]|nr:hypothetical protein [Pseudomonadota bacterium]